MFVKPTTRPSSRSQFSLLYHNYDNNPKIILFGGISSERLNDLWICETKTMNWKKLQPLAEIPPSRSSHTAVLFRNEMFIYGGQLDLFQLKEDILIYDIIGNRFFSEKCFNKTEVKWRRHHVALSIGPHMFINGGLDDNDNILSDSWLLEFINLKWVKLETKGIKPLAVASHACSLVIPRDKKQSHFFSVFKIAEIPPQHKANKKIKIEGIYLFGGIDEDGNYRNDIQIIKIGKKIPERIAPKISGNPPCPRADCSMNFYEELNICIIYGGKNEKSKKSFLNDFYILDLEYMQWFVLYATDGFSRDNSLALARAEHDSVIFNNKLIIFGGSSGTHFIGSEFFQVHLDLFEINKNFNFNQRQAVVAKDLNDLLNKKETKNYEIKASILKSSRMSIPPEKNNC